MGALVGGLRPDCPCPSGRIQAGRTRYRFLLGDEEYKSRFTSSEPEVETLGWSNSARGAVALAAVGLMSKLPPGLRRLANPDA